MKEYNLQQQNSISGLSLFFMYLLLITFALGEYIFTLRIFEIQWYAYRILVIVLLIFGVNSRFNSKIEKSFIYFGVLLFLYGMVMMLWMSNPINGFRYSVNIAFGILLIYIFLGLINTKQVSPQLLFNLFARAWMIAVFFTLFYVVKQYVTGENLEFSRQRAVFGVQKSTQLYTGSFEGSSGYGSFLVIGLPLYFYMLFSAKNFWEKVIFYIGIFLTCGVIILTGSRTAAVAMVIVFLMSIVVNIKYKALNIFILLIGVIIAVFISYQINPDVYNKHFVVTKHSIENMDKQSSLKERIAEIPNGVAILISTNGLGCGPGNYGYYKVDHKDILPYPQQYWMGSHSVLLSLLAEYGIIVFVAFLYWYFYVLISLIKMSRTLKIMKRIGDSMIAKTLIILQIGFFIWSFAFGGGLDFYLIWLYFATITILSSSLSIYTENLKKKLQLYNQAVLEEQA